MKKSLPVIVESSIANCRNLKADISTLLQEEVLGETVCRKGCSHCCHHPILISVLEGVLLYWHLRNNGLWSKELEFKLENHTDHVKSLDLDIWMLSNIPCPLLSQDNLCTAYAARPILCATAYSRAIPDLCKPENFSITTPWHDRIDYLKQYYALEQSVLQNIKHPGVMFPISTAILIAHETLRDGFSSDDVRQYARLRLQ